MEIRRHGALEAHYMCGDMGGMEASAKETRCRCSDMEVRRHTAAVATW